MATKLGQIVADFRTSLATRLSISGTSATLQSATDDDNVALPSGVYYFTIDGDNAQKEHIRCSLVGTALTSIQSVSRQGVLTSGAAREHRIGASVVITDFAHIKFISDLLDGVTDLDSTDPLAYDGAVTLTPGSNQLATVDYVDDTAFAGAPDATATTKGIFEKATDAELQSGAADGSGNTSAPLAATTTSFRQAATANKVPVADANGEIDDGYIALTTQGDIVYRDASNLARLPIGTAGHALKVNSGATAPEWGAIPSSLFGDGSDGDVTISAGTTTLTRDMYYDDLTIQTGGVLDANGFRVFVKGILTYQGTGIIQNNGGNGGNASGGSAGSAGAAANTTGSLPASAAGQTGGTGTGTSNPGGAGTNGTAAAKCLGAAGAAGGAGGNASGGSGGAAGTAGAVSGTVFNSPRSIWGAYTLFDTQPSVAAFTGQGGSGSGGGGAGSGSGTGGGGGGSGAPGGVVWVAAAQIVTVNGNVYIQATGGNGGNGAAGTGQCGGGGGGGGGNGGIVILIYQIKTGTGTISVAAGALGTGASGAGAGLPGANGSNGTAGTTFEIQV